MTGRKRPTIRRKDSTSPRSAGGSATSANTGRKESPGCAERTSDVPNRPASARPLVGDIDTARYGEAVAPDSQGSQSATPGSWSVLADLRSRLPRCWPHGNRWSSFWNCVSVAATPLLGYNGFAVSCGLLKFARWNDRVDDAVADETRTGRATSHDADVSVVRRGWQRSGTGGVRFNEHIRPILSEFCLQCHGPDAENREGDLRLDVEAAAKESAIVVGKARRERVVQADGSPTMTTLRMPPVDSGKTLTKQQIELVRQWMRREQSTKGTGRSNRFGVLRFLPLVTRKLQKLIASYSRGCSRTGCRSHQRSQSSNSFDARRSI